MAMRNFWIEAEADGIKTPVRTGPRPKDGGFALRIYQRVEGESVKVADVWGRVDSEGRLALTVEGTIDGMALTEGIAEGAQLPGFAVRSER